MNIFFYNIVSKLFNIIELSIFIECILSWIPNMRGNSFTDLLYKVNEPFLKPGRYIQNKLMPGLMIDFSPVIALLLIDLIKNILIRILIL